MVNCIFEELRVVEMSVCERESGVRELSRTVNSVASFIPFLEIRRRFRDSCSKDAAALAFVWLIGHFYPRRVKSRRGDELQI